MNSNQKKLRKMIQDQTLTITDEELFVSSDYQQYQTNLAKAATRRYRYGLQVLMEWNPDPNGAVAYTDNYKIHNNAANLITQSFPSRFLRSQSLIGLTGHEVGHILYTDFASLKLYLTDLKNGVLYPEVPAVTGACNQKNLDDILDSLKDEGVALTLTHCASTLNNILEDVYIEARVCEDFPGQFRLGIQINNLRFAEQIPSIQEQIDKNYKDFCIMSNLILAYCKTGTINNLSGYSGPYMDLLEECMPLVEDSLYTDDIKERFRTTNLLLVLLWQYIKPLVEETKEQMKQNGKQDAEQELEETLGSQVKGGAPLPLGKNGSMPVNHNRTKGSASCVPETRQDEMKEAQKVVAEETGRMDLVKTTAILDENNPGVTYNHQYAGSGYEDAAKDLFRILNTIATEKAEAQYQQELTEELQKLSDQLHYGNAHQGIHITINRIARVPNNMITRYQTIAPPLMRVSKHLQSTIAPLLKDETESAKMKNLLYGKRLDARALYREDGGIFTRTRLPEEEGRLAVGMVIDESGSMASEDRITHCRKTAIILYDFCKSLGIPITIYGHSTGGGVQLYSYAEFDSLDATDRYRLMDLSARNGNRDGAAIRFVAELLVKRPEQRKLLIILSDGQPADTGYYGTEAEADLRGIKREFENRGLVIFAAAIGDDKENIKRIYKDGFLDITNLEHLSKNLTRLIKQYLINERN